MSRCWYIEIQSTVVIADRVSLILADTVLIVITWKRIMPEGAMKANKQINLTKTKGVTYVMLYNGSSASILTSLYTQI